MTLVSNHKLPHLKDSLKVSSAQWWWICSPNSVVCVIPMHLESLKKYYVKERDRLQFNYIRENFTSVNCPFAMQQHQAKYFLENGGGKRMIFIYIKNLYQTNVCRVTTMSFWIVICYGICIILIFILRNSVGMGNMEPKRPLAAPELFCCCCCFQNPSPMAICRRHIF